MTPALPYENQLIGAFLYALGSADATYARRDAAATDAPAAMVLNLFQQTPLDATFNDLVAGRERCVVIEFKRSAHALDEERLKRKSTLRTALRSEPTFRTSSLRGHVVVYGHVDGKAVDMRLCTYLDVLGLAEPVKLDRGSGYALAVHLAHPSPTKAIGLEPEPMLDYLERLRELRAEQVGAGGRQARETWLGIARNAKGLVTVTASSLEGLLGRPEQAHEPEFSHDVASNRDRDMRP